MANLSYCYLEVFGSNFDVEKFSQIMSLPDAIIEKRDKVFYRSPIKALRKGNVSYWKTQKKYFKCNDDTHSIGFEEYEQEERFLVDFIKDYYHLRDVLCKYKNDTTETWFVAVYKALPNEQPAGVHFGYGLIEALHKIEASISTEIIFV